MEMRPDVAYETFPCRCCGMLSVDQGDGEVFYCTGCSVTCVPATDEDLDQDGECHGHRYCDEEGCTIRHG